MKSLASIRRIMRQFVRIQMPDWLVVIKICVAELLFWLPRRHTVVFLLVFLGRRGIQLADYPPGVHLTICQIIHHCHATLATSNSIEEVHWN